MADCRRFESESNCTLTIIGEEDEVVNAAAEHAASVHGHTDTPELREQIRGTLEPESAFTPGERQTEAFPG
jgi:predicted small metal-binding protein